MASDDRPRDENDPQPPGEAPFEFGEGTILQLKNQQFEVEEFGTVILRAAHGSVENAPAANDMRTVALPLPEGGEQSLNEAPAESASEIDPLSRVEEKLDLALRMIAQLKQQLDSLDATIARMLMR